MMYHKHTYILKLLCISLCLNMLQAADTNTTIRIMPLGDSLTYDNTYADAVHPRPDGIRTGYRGYLWYMLKDANYTADFVGSQRAGYDVKPPIDPDHEGHMGMTSHEIAALIYDSLALYQPDIILLHAGTNDHTSTPSGVEAILNQINYYKSTSGKDVRVIVAQLMARKAPDARIDIFNKKLKELVYARMLKGEHLQLVDMYHDASIPSSHYVDATHPDSYGYSRMAAVWFKALTSPYNPALRSYPGTVVSSTYIKDIIFDDAADTVTFTTEIPDTGITF